MRHRSLLVVVKRVEATSVCTAGRASLSKSKYRSYVVALQWKCLPEAVKQPHIYCTLRVDPPRSQSVLLLLVAWLFTLFYFTRTVTHLAVYHCRVTIACMRCGVVGFLTHKLLPKRQTLVSFPIVVVQAICFFNSGMNMFIVAYYCLQTYV